MAARRPFLPYVAPFGATPRSRRASSRRGMGGDIAAAASVTVMPAMAS